MLSKIKEILRGLEDGTEALDTLATDLMHGIEEHHRSDELMKLLNQLSLDIDTLIVEAEGDFETLED